MILGGFVPSSGHAGKYFLKALKVKSKLTKEVTEAFKKYDFLIAPTVPILPFKIGEKMKVSIGSDHAGVKLKAKIKEKNSFI